MSVRHDPSSESNNERAALMGLIAVSNRQPYAHRRVRERLVCEPTDGGLTTAIDPVLRRLGGTWIAWGSGEADRAAVGPDDAVEVPPDAPAYRLRRVWLADDEVTGGYAGYANEVLWPLCHMTLDRVAYRKAYWESYRSLNRRFAQAVVEEFTARPGLVWVHDFHLALLPALVKQVVPQAVLAVFWHIPWPGPDVFRILPERREFLEGLLKADGVTFHTPGYARAFADCVQRFLGATIEASGELVQYQGHHTRLTARPIGVDFRTLSGLAWKTAGVEGGTGALRPRLGVRPDLRIGLGVDRLDYSKGLLKRLWALDAFFSRHPDYRGRFTFVQIAVPTRNEIEAYHRYREIIRETVSDINDRYRLDRQLEKPGWQPIEYLEGRIGLPTLVAYYRAAELALVSSVYDGMNLVAKEYVACQVEETGVLLVSQMAGAADELTDALIINPYDLEGVADAIRHALEMPVEERQRRMRAHLAAHDVHAWVEGCLADAGMTALCAHSL